MFDDLLTTDETAKVLRVSQKTVLRMVRSGGLHAHKVGRSWRIRRSDLPCRLVPGSDGVVYLDDNASNPVHPDVVEAVVDVLRMQVGNASSAHSVGERSHGMVEDARERLADLVGARPKEVVHVGRYGGEQPAVARVSVPPASASAGQRWRT